MSYPVVGQRWRAAGRGLHNSLIPPGSTVAGQRKARSLNQFRPVIYIRLVSPQDYIHRVLLISSVLLPPLPSFRLSLVLKPFIFLAGCCCCDYFALPVLENKGINLHILAYILIIRKHGTRVENFLTTGRKRSD